MVRVLLKDVELSARALGLQVHALSASTESDIDSAFATIVQQQMGALFVGAGPLLLSRRKQIATLAARHAVPAIYLSRRSVTVAGLMSYASSQTDVRRQIGIYTGKILKGAKPVDLPILQPTKFELAISVNAAKALGLTIPQSILLRANELIE